MPPHPRGGGWGRSSAWWRGKCPPPAMEARLRRQRHGVPLREVELELEQAAGHIAPAREAVAWRDTPRWPEPELLEHPTRRGIVDEMAGRQPRPAQRVACRGDRRPPC